MKVWGVAAFPYLKLGSLLSTSVNLSLFKHLLISAFSVFLPN